MRLIELHEIQRDPIWNKVKEGTPYEWERGEYLFSFNFEDDLCEVLYGRWLPNSYGNGSVPRSMWVCGTIGSQEEFIMDDMLAWKEIDYGTDFVTAYFALKKGTTRVSDFLKLNELYYSSPDFVDNESDAVYEIRLMTYYHILPNEIESMTKNGFVEIAGLNASESSFKKLYDKIEI